MPRERGFILLLVLILIMMLTTNIMWSAGLQIQAVKLLNASISRLHLDVELERKITEISEVLSKNASVWFNQSCAAGFCTVPGRDWGEQWYELGDLMIERWVSGPEVVLRINAYAHTEGAVARRQCMLLCRITGCVVQTCRKG